MHGKRARGVGISPTVGFIIFIHLLSAIILMHQLMAVSNLEDLLRVRFETVPSTLEAEPSNESATLSH